MVVKAASCPRSEPRGRGDLIEPVKSHKLLSAEGDLQSLSAHSQLMSNRAEVLQVQH